MCHLTSRPKVMRICNAYWTQSARRIYAICEIDDTVFTQRWVLEVAFIIILNDGKIKRDWQIYKCSQIVEMDAVSWDHFPRGPTRSPWCRVSMSPDQPWGAASVSHIIHCYSQHPLSAVCCIQTPAQPVHGQRCYVGYVCCVMTLWFAFHYHTGLSCSPDFWPGLSLHGGLAECKVASNKY